eukprot:CAMPEP_0167779684 /NCGR_PEP_ID=MMETSP0111_2-20121227/4942_1 /TAXON_ID=91324 /ORGANISM="Lotharella globosa, Strain CCCM811" /LENGTH=588 /DNA_ID=CAMNT_0007670119 /DNA_START=154 /DNA_END=1922 /DNA_ORIENTATION=+
MQSGIRLKVLRRGKGAGRCGWVESVVLGPFNPRDTIANVKKTIHDQWDAKRAGQPAPAPESQRLEIRQGFACEDDATLDDYFGFGGKKKGKSKIQTAEIMLLVDQQLAGVDATDEEEDDLKEPSATRKKRTRRKRKKKKPFRSKGGGAGEGDQALGGRVAYLRPVPAREAPEGVQQDAAEEEGAQLRGLQGKSEGPDEGEGGLAIQEFEARSTIEAKAQYASKHGKKFMALGKRSKMAIMGRFSQQDRDEFMGLLDRYRIVRPENEIHAYETVSPQGRYYLSMRVYEKNDIEVYDSNRHAELHFGYASTTSGVKAWSKVLDEACALFATCMRLWDPPPSIVKIIAEYWSEVPRPGLPLASFHMPSVRCPRFLWSSRHRAFPRQTPFVFLEPQPVAQSAQSGGTLPVMNDRQFVSVCVPSKERVDGKGERKRSDPGDDWLVVFCGPLTGRGWLPDKLSRRETTAFAYNLRRGFHVTTKVPLSGSFLQTYVYKASASLCGRHIVLAPVEEDVNHGIVILDVEDAGRKEMEPSYVFQRPTEIFVLWTKGQDGWITARNGAPALWTSKGLIRRDGPRWTWVEDPEDAHSEPT